MKYDPEYVKQRYDNLAQEEWDRLEKDRLGELLYKVHRDILERHIKSTDHVIEFGAGAGRYTKDLAIMSGDLVTSDISHEQLEMNVRKMKELGLYEKVKEFRSLDISKLTSINDNSYDVAVCIGGVINYLLSEEKNAISEMLRIIKSGGKLILGSMSRIGAIIYYMEAVIQEYKELGMASTRWLFETGILDEEHYPVKNKHLIHMMTASELKKLFEKEKCEIIETSSAGLFMHSNEKILNIAKQDENFWNFLIEKEIELTKLPGTLECGMNIIYVVRKL